MTTSRDVRKHLEDRLEACLDCDSRSKARLFLFDGTHWRVECACGCLGPADPLVAGAAERWNVRARAVRDRLCDLRD